MPAITLQPSKRVIHVPGGTNLLEACHRAGVGIPAACGGKGICGKCRVRVFRGEVPPDTGHEQALSPAEVAAGWRLACLVEVDADLEIETPTDIEVRNVILTDFEGREAVPDGGVHAIPLELSPPSLEDQICDIGRIMRGLHMEHYPRAALPLLQEVPKRLRECDFKITVVMEDGELLGVEPYWETPHTLGLALDIGTTTIAGALFDLLVGTPLAFGSSTNAQALRGDDVVTRIDHARTGEEARVELQRLVVKAAEDILRDTCAQAGVKVEQVYMIAIGGNTTMHHLFMGLDPSFIAESPFIPSALRGLTVRASDLGLRAGHGARVYGMPNISAYVGGDIVAGLLAHEVHTSDQTILLIDVGTNGEMALRAGGKTYACATAAGPAFEGARISCGMRAATGAICAVDAGGTDVLCTTVDNSPARGLCGTGLLDAVAVLLDLGIVDARGRMLAQEEAREECPDLSEEMLARIVTGDDDQTAFMLSEAEGSFPRITLTQKDIREFQLAKGAVAAGMSVMLEHVGLAASELEQVLLAGAFGAFLRPESAQRVGLLPPEVPVDRVSFVGNAALAGTRLCLLNHACRDEAEQIASEVDYIELSGQPGFQMAFMEAMVFPEGMGEAT